ncbi:thiamine pyrophosphate-binding protein, partial [Nostoc sp. 'Peltigera malacea cyanobiont' DB3992]|uniref:thiamine pyrophosphate-binding protein n=1 Tax=Nostoc sp. 'Peltigera malacea cyanobiont' DB3992 TaxID=1206980 RepID=UPI000C05EA02
MRSPDQITLPQTDNHKQSRISSPPVVPKRASGGFALLDSLHRHGVDYIFGYPGGAILPIYDDLYKV